MSIEVRPLRESDLDEADRIFRLAFGTFLGMPEPIAFAAGADLIGTRWRASRHNMTFGAFDGDMLIGTNVATRWGSFGFFGPLTILPDYWDKGIAQMLLGPTMDAFDQWGVRAAGLFTFPQSPKHLALYQKYEFWPQHLTAIMAKPVVDLIEHIGLFSGPRNELLAGARSITEATFAGLDLTDEIEAVIDQNLGEVVALYERDMLTAFAICHIGVGSEAGPDAAFIKFAAARPGAQKHFAELLMACEATAARRGMATLVAGVNAACHSAYLAALAHGFRTQFSGVAMQRRNDPGYLASDAFVIGDWR